MRCAHFFSLIVTTAALCLHTTASGDEAYVQHQNIVYAETHGIGLVMDVFVPTGEKNGLGIVDVASGAWNSLRGRINDHKRAKLFDIYCGRGYTVFAVRPGSVTKFTGLEMLDHVHRSIRWIKQHASQYNIDPKRLGMTGASAGGHLACLAAVTSDQQETSVAAVDVFFPPTDLVELAGSDTGLQSDTRVSRSLAALAFNGRLQGVTDEQIRDTLTRLSPARLVTGKEPPFLLIHGDADDVVPLSQSEIMIAALKKKEVAAELIVKPGGGHPWLTIHEEVAVIADWMDKQLQPSVGSPSR